MNRVLVQISFELELELELKEVKADWNENDAEIKKAIEQYWSNVGFNPIYYNYNVKEDV